MKMKMIENMQEYYDHYFRWLGDVKEVHTYDENNPYKVNVWCFDKTYPDFPEYTVLATLGVYKSEGTVGGLREVMTVTNSSYELVSYVLYESVRYLVGEGVKLDAGFSLNGIENISEEFVEKYGKSAIMFVDGFGFPEEFWKVGREGAMLSCVFLTEDEYEYIVQYGIGNFLGEFINTDVNAFDIERESIFKGNKH